MYRVGAWSGSWRGQRCPSQLRLSQASACLCHTCLPHAPAHPAPPQDGPPVVAARVSPDRSLLLLQRGPHLLELADLSTGNIAVHGRCGVHGCRGLGRACAVGWCVRVPCPGPLAGIPVSCQVKGVCSHGAGSSDSGSTPHMRQRQPAPLT